MHDAGAVCSCQSCRYLSCYVQRLTLLQRVGCHLLAQRHTIDVLHHNVVTTIFHFTNFMDHAHVWVIE